MGGNAEDPRPPYGLSLVMISFMAIAWFNGVEVLFKVFFTFRRRGGLYFYSIIAATVGIFLYVIGFATKFFVTVPGTDWVGVAFVVAGWVPMITGQSLALYSRLHIVVRDLRKLRWVFYMIIIDAVLFHGPICVLIFLGETTEKMWSVYQAYEKTELTAFSIQETVISGLYIYETWKMLRPAKTAQGRRMRGIRRHLIYVNTVVILMDITLLATQFTNHYKVQTSYKAFVYSVKLKLEFAILNRLVAATRKAQGSGGSGGNNNNNNNNNIGDASARDIFGSGSNRMTAFGGSHLGKVGPGGMQSIAEATCSANHHSKVGDDDASGGMDVEMEERNVGVMKTTEVRIESHKRDEEPANSDPEQEGTEGTEGSRASSEVRFAAAGF